MTCTALPALRLFLFACWLVVSCGASAGADVAAQAEMAVQQYRAALEMEDRTARRATFREAAQLFRQVATAQPTAAGWSNAGNAALQAEERGQAILAYRRALQLDPRYGQARSNLSRARQQLPARWQPQRDESLLGTIFFWNEILAGSAPAWAAFAFAVGCALAAIAFRFDKPTVRNLAVIPFLLWATLLLSFLVSAQGGIETAAVIVEPEVTAYTADSRHATPQFAEPLPGGVELAIDEERLDWVRVELPNGDQTWLPRSSVAWVVPREETTASSSVETG